MSQTYYDSTLTKDQIQAALVAVHGLIDPTNNGKIVYVHDGKLGAKAASAFDTSGEMQAKTVTPSAAQQIVTPDTGYNGLSQVTVNGDADLVAGNIKDGIEIFGVTGSYTGGGSPVLQEKTATQNGVVLPDSGYDGLSKVTVNVSGGGGDPYTSNIIQTDYTKLFDRPEAFFALRFPDEIYPVQTVVQTSNAKANKASVDPTKVHTAYAVVKGIVNDNRILNIFNSGVSNLVCIYTYGKTLYSYANNNRSTIKTNAKDYFACAVQYNPNTGACKFYVDKALKAESSISALNSLSIVQLNGTEESYIKQEYIKHFAVVEGDGADSDETVIANLTALEQLYEIS